MKLSHKYLIIFLGPTAVGKTALCLKIAQLFQTEIISSDSRQFYKETNIGTAKPTESELKSVPHHLIGTKSIHNPYDVKDFENEALQVLDVIFKTHDIAIMAGGSGLYIDVICKGLDDIPDIEPKIREKIISEFEEKGIEFLQRELEKFDPDYFQTVDRNNPQRLMRAIEVFRGTGKPFSSFRVKNLIQRPFKIIKIGLEREREELYERINKRMEMMIRQGLFEEAEALFPFRHLNALQTVGYSEIFGYLEGKYDKEEAVRLLKRNSRRYAKRQMTWFRRDSEVLWFHPEQEKEIIQCIKNEIIKAEKP
ncbi:tRNA (adenosine(37)-N6)-dimethylallyltransferase MiaA [Shivajiella indica]|uniref:tRNA dimethylallyltransferase n=1 Tax=Shivajiella indica TaxID=872115 RepID=A0ABW5BED8_9BACT